MTATREPEVAVTSGWREPVIAGAAIAVVHLVLALLADLVSAVAVVGGLLGMDIGPYLVGFASEVGQTVFRDVIFGVGVVLVLRLVGPMASRSGWRPVALRILLVAGAGAVVVFVVLVIAALVPSFSPGQYPFGYSFEPSVDGYSLARGVLSAFFAGLYAFLSGVPVVGLVLLWSRAFRSDRAVVHSA